MSLVGVGMGSIPICSWKKARIGRGGFEIADEISYQRVVAVAALLQQEMAVISDIAQECSNQRFSASGGRGRICTVNAEFPSTCLGNSSACIKC
ncbi:hypothetical protein [Paracoccus sp. pheM1]|uniref:hypothetical protein n=1 Tax=Paracoccus sp. pheM1 TaxID=2831675 RepID=UPI001BDB8FCC|nr:hypothetical protein [Paracoccus sp. pheM1]MBT0778320.1 hypothetical protein [Paracoccus sp. pheM1]